MDAVKVHDDVKIAGIHGMDAIDKAIQIDQSQENEPVLSPTVGHEIRSMITGEAIRAPGT